MADPRYPPSLPEQCTAAEIFGVVWEAMSDILGTAATATLMRRSIKRAAERTGAVDDLAIARQGFEYSYNLPEDWRAGRPESLAALREIMKELSPLLQELTGPIVTRRLNALPEIRRCELTFEEPVE